MTSKYVNVTAQLENVVDMPGYSEVPVNKKKGIKYMCNERTHPLLHPF